MTDADLVRQTLAGRTQAYEELVRRWAGRVTALCHAKLGCRAAADDVAQEVLFRGFRALASLTDPDKFGAWLCRIAARSCIDWLRSRSHGVLRFSEMGGEQNADEVLGGREDDESGMDQADELRRLREEVASLPEVYREVVLLYYHEEMTYRDLARMLGVSTATINARLTRARDLLRERLTECPTSDF